MAAVGITIFNTVSEEKFKISVIAKRYNYLLFSRTMASIREEIADIAITLSQISEERNNLLKALRVEEDNFNHYFRLYQDKFEALLKEKNETNEKLLRDNARISAHFLGDDAPVLEHKY